MSVAAGTGQLKEKQGQRFNVIGDIDLLAAESSEWAYAYRIPDSDDQEFKQVVIEGYHVSCDAATDSFRLGWRDRATGVIIDADDPLTGTEGRRILTPCRIVGPKGQDLVVEINEAAATAVDARFNVWGSLLKAQS